MGSEVEATHWRSLGWQIRNSTGCFRPKFFETIEEARCALEYSKTIDPSAFLAEVFESELFPDLKFVPVAAARPEPASDFDVYASWARSRLKEEMDAAEQGRLYAAGAPRAEESPTDAPGILRHAAEILGKRGEMRDADEERSMERAVAIFNAAVGERRAPLVRIGPDPGYLSTREGWLFMVCLKIARAQGPGHVRDDYDDLVGYAALLAEEALRDE